MEWNSYSKKLFVVFIILLVALTSLLVIQYNDNIYSTARLCEFAFTDIGINNVVFLSPINERSDFGPFLLSRIHFQHSREGLQLCKDAANNVILPNSGVVNFAADKFSHYVDDLIAAMDICEPVLKSNLTSSEVASLRGAFLNASGTNDTSVNQFVAFITTCEMIATRLR